MKWEIREDVIVCSFYLKYKSNWRKHTKELQDRLEANGYSSRDIKSATMRVSNFEAIRTGKGLKNYSKQSKMVYDAMVSPKANKQGLSEFLLNPVGMAGVHKAPSYASDYDIFKPAPSLTRFMTIEGKEVREPKSKTFLDLLIESINKSGLTNKEIYDEAFINRRYFSKIISGEVTPTIYYVVRICFALKLSYKETVELLASGNMALSKSNTTDVIIAWFLQNEEWNLVNLEETLLKNKLPTILPS